MTLQGDYCTTIAAITRLLHCCLLQSQANLARALSFGSRESYNHVSSWLADARSLANPDIVIILVGNKKDKEKEREVTFLEASRFSQENGVCTIQASHPSVMPCATAILTIVAATYHR
jgi:GTPase SAR1 family protein